MKRIVAGVFLALFMAQPGFAQQITRIDLVANDLVYDAVSARLYASVPGSVGPNGNSIAVIDPTTGVIETYVWVGSEPDQLAVSDDGQYLYVGLDGAFAVRRLHLGTLTAGLQFSVGTDQYCGPYQALDIAVLPGDADSAAVVRKCPTSSGDGGVAIYTNGVMRPTTTPGIYGPRTLAFSSTGDRLYGINTGSSPSSFFRMNVSAEGVRLADSTRQLFKEYARDIRMHQGLIYASHGEILDPETLALAGALPPGSTPYNLQDVVPDAQAGLVYAISRYPEWLVEAFAFDTLIPRWSFSIPGATGDWRSLTRWGDGGLAFVTDESQVFVIDLTNGRPLVLDKGGSGDGTVTSAPAGIQCGSRCVALFPGGTIVSLTAAADSNATFVGWAGDSDCTDGIVALSAARSCTAVFAQRTTGLGLQLPLAVNDLVYSAATQRIYASIPGRDPVRGNTITVIDPATGQLGPSVGVGSEPNRLALSSDGTTLYVGLDGAAAARRVGLQPLLPGPQFSLGRSQFSGPFRAMDLAVLPGDPSSVAVVRSTDSSGYGSVAIYSNGVMRPTTTPEGYGSRVLEFPDYASRLYGNSGYDFVRMAVVTDGVSVVDQTRNLFTDYREDIHFDGGLLYGDRGRVVDPATLSVLGTFPLSTSAYTFVGPDVSRDVVYFLEDRYGGEPPDVSLFDPARFTFRRSVEVPDVTGAADRFITAGAGRVAFATDEDHVFLVDVNAPVSHLLNVQSTPFSAVTITVDVADLQGAASGATPFSRRYARGTTVTLTAPANLGEAVFQGWVSGYTTLTTSPQVSVAVNDSASIRAEYTVIAPTVAAVQPATGGVAGGTLVTILGSNFVGSPTVTIGGMLASSVFVLNPTTLVARTPAHAAGVVEVRVGSGRLANAFTYTSSSSGPFRRYFAEGAATDFFDCSFALANPGTTSASVTLTFLRDDTGVVFYPLTLPAHSRRTVDAKSVPGLAPAGGFSTVVESDVDIVVDRTMSWSGVGYGSHAETSMAAPAYTWYLAEGATHSGFRLYYLIENPNADPVSVGVTYMRPAPYSPLVLQYANIPGHSRRTIYVNDEHPDLANTDVSGVVTSLTPRQPIIVERALYLNSQGTFFNAGTDSAGVMTPSTDWFLAEGATLGVFDMYVLLANPGDTPANAIVTFLLPGGRTVQKHYPVAARSRQTVWVNGVRDEMDPTLDFGNVSVSAKIHADVPIIVERSMWWSGGPTAWREGHNGVGTTETGTVWALAEGEQGGARNTQTYVLVANTSSFAGRARVTLLFEDGTTPASVEIDVPANSRTTVWTGGAAATPETPFGGLAEGKRFGTLVESLDTASGRAQIVVERAMYSDAAGVWWAAGTNALASRIQ